MSEALKLIRPRDWAEAARLLAEHEDAAIIAGGTALQLEWAKGAPTPKILIALDGIAGGRGVRRIEGALHIGALTSLGDLERCSELKSAAPLLALALTSVAAPAVRNLASLGGNIAGRAGCLPPALLALDARLQGVDPQGPWELSLERFLFAPPRPGRILSAIILPESLGEDRWTHRKIGLRAAFTPSVIGVAGWMRVEAGSIVQARLAVGGGVVPPARLARSEASLTGHRLSEIDWAAVELGLRDEILAPDDVFRTGRYRSMVAAKALTVGLGGWRSKPSSRQASPPDSAEPPAGEILINHAAQAPRWHERPDGAAKIAGRFAYLTDHRAPDMLIGRILRSAHAHARILSIDASRAEALPGVVAVVTHRDIPGLNGFGIVIQDQPALCHDKARYLGDAVAAVAAVDAATAEAALALIDVAYDPLPLVTDPEQALAEGAPLVHETGNLQRLIEFKRGDGELGFASAAHVVEATYVTPRQMHGFMETEGGWAVARPDGMLEIHAGGQHGARDRTQLARILDRPEESIRVVTSPTGGAFGGKDELTVQPALALLALKTGRPVRLKLSRAESVVAGVKRHPMVIRMRTGCDAEGRLLAQQVDLLADAGAYASLGPAVLETAMEHAAGPYVIPHVATRGRLAYTNNGVGGAFRGFGANQMAYAVECQMDRLAKLCGVSPIEIRRRNLKPVGAPGFLGQTVAPSERLEEMLAAAAASPLWREPSAVSTEEIIGVGMAMNYHGNGLGSVIPDPAGGRLRLAPDGRIEAVFTLDEMGQGLLPAILSTVSDQLGCGREDIRPIYGDTAGGPDSGSTTASRGTFVVWRTTRLAGPTFAAKLCEAAGAALGRDPTSLRLAKGGIADRTSNTDEILLSYSKLAQGLSAPIEVDASFEYPKTDFTTGNARYLFVYGACLARVAVNRVTGQIRVLDLDQHTAAGPVLDVSSYLGQLEGGAVQGLGFTLSEDSVIRDGAYVTGNFDGYIMPSIVDAPERMRVLALESLDPDDPYGPRGAGELGVGAVTPAIANAVFAAIGFSPSVSPIPPEAVLDALGAAP